MTSETAQPAYQRVWWGAIRTARHAVRVMRYAAFIYFWSGGLILALLIVVGGVRPADAAAPLVLWIPAYFMLRRHDMVSTMVSFCVPFAFFLLAIAIAIFFTNTASARWLMMTIVLLFAVLSLVGFRALMAARVFKRLGNGIDVEVFS